MKNIKSFLFGSITLGVTFLLSAEPSIVKAAPITISLRDGSEILVSANYEVDVKAKEPESPKPRKMAIFVRNLMKDQRMALPCDILVSQVSALVSSSEIEIMDYRDSVLAIAPLLELSITSENIQTIEQQEHLARQISDAYNLGTSRHVTQDQKLLANTSYTNLARNMGADYVLMLSLENFSKSERKLRDARFGKAIDSDGTTIKTTTCKISASYRVLDAVSGASIGGGVVSAKRTYRTSASMETSYDSPTEGLEENIAEALAEEILSHATTWRFASVDIVGIPVTFDVSAYDMNNQPIYLPMYDGTTPVVNERKPASVSATIEVDGVVVGTSSQTIMMPSGMHKVRISRPGYDDITMHMVPRDGMIVGVNLRMQQSEYNRIKDSITFMHQLTTDRELNQAEVKVLEGHAKELEQSGVRIDAKELPNQMIEYRDLIF